MLLNNSLLNLSGYSQLEKLFLKRWRISFGYRAEHYQLNDSITNSASIIRGGLNYKITEGTEVSSRIIKKINGDYKFSSLGKEWNPTDELWKDKNSEDYSEFWKENKKKIRQFLEENEIKENKDFNNKAVIHFRCSDVPFNKDENYNLLPKEYFHFALEKIEKQTNTKTTTRTTTTTTTTTTATTISSSNSGTFE